MHIRLHLKTNISIRQCISLPVFSSFHHSTYRSTYLVISLAMYLSVHWPVYLCPSSNPDIYLSPKSFLPFSVNIYLSITFRSSFHFFLFIRSLVSLSVPLTICLSFFSLPVYSSFFRLSAMLNIFIFTFGVSLSFRENNPQIAFSHLDDERKQSVLYLLT